MFRGVFGFSRQFPENAIFGRFRVPDRLIEVPVKYWLAEVGHKGDPYAMGKIPNSVGGEFREVDWA